MGRVSVVGERRRLRLVQLLIKEHVRPLLRMLAIVAPTHHTEAEGAADASQISPTPIAIVIAVV